MIRATSGALLAMAAAGCVWTSDGGFAPRVESDWEGTAESAPGSWEGSPIRIANEEGGVEIVGVEGLDHIRVRARFVAGADTDADAQAAFEDAAASLAVEKRDGAWWVDCPGATEDHGSAVASSTGCSVLRVEVPAGSAAAPLDVGASVGFGGVHASGLVVAHLDLSAPFGVVADVTPVAGARVRLWGEDLVSGLCHTVLRIPGETTIDAATLSVQHVDVTYLGFDERDAGSWIGAAIDGFADAPDIAPRTPHVEWAHPGEGNPHAARIELRASIGQARLTTGAVPAFDERNQCVKIEIEGSIGG